MPISTEHDIFRGSTPSTPRGRNRESDHRRLYKARYYGTHSDLARTESLKNSCLVADRNGVLRRVEHHDAHRTPRRQRTHLVMVRFGCRRGRISRRRTAEPIEADSV